MLKTLIVAMFAAMIVLTAGCGGSDGSAAEVKKVKAAPLASAQGKPMVKVEVTAAKKPSIYLHRIKKTVIIVRDEVGLGLEPHWKHFDDLLSNVFGELNLDRPRTFEFCWVANPKQDSLVAFRPRDKKPDDRYVQVMIQVAHLQGRNPQKCRDLVQSSFLVALNTIESGNKNYATIRALIEPRLAYVFDNAPERSESAGKGFAPRDSGQGTE